MVNTELCESPLSMLTCLNVSPLSTVIFPAKEIAQLNKHIHKKALNFFKLLDLQYPNIKKKYLYPINVDFGMNILSLEKMFKKLFSKVRC